MTPPTPPSSRRARARSLPTVIVTLLAVLLPLLASLLASVVLAAPAHATRRTVEDAQRDVLKQVGQQPPVPAGRNASADLTRFTAVMGRNKLILQTSVRRLPRNFWAMLWQVRTDAGVDYAVDLMKTGDLRFQLTSGRVPVLCEGMTRRIEPALHRVTVTVPLVCLGSPTSARTGAGAAATARDFSRIYTDDAQRAGAFTSAALQLGRPVRRG